MNDSIKNRVPAVMPEPGSVSALAADMQSTGHAFDRVAPEQFENESSFVLPNADLSETKPLSQDELDIMRWMDDGGALGPVDGTGGES